MRPIRVYIVYIIVATLNIFIFMSMYIFIPQLRPRFILEDYFMENLTATLYFGSFLLALVLMAKSKEQIYRKAYFAVLLVSLVGLLEELSWGERLLNITMPRIHGVKIDSFHDIGHLAYSVPKAHSDYLAAISVLAAFGILIFLVIAIIAKYRKYLNRIPDIFKTYPPIGFVLIYVCLVSIALTIDLDIVRVRGLRFIEELCEMNAALVLSFLCFSMAHNKVHRLQYVASESP